MVKHLPGVFVLRLAAIALAAVAAGGASAAPQADPFADIYARGVAKQKAMRSLRGRFVETTTSTLLVRPLVARGTFIAAAPARVRMSYAEPEPKTLTMDGRTLTIVWPARGEREQIDVTAIQKRVDQYFTNASRKDLQSMFEIQVRSDAAMRERDRVEMRPTQKRIAQGLSRLELWIDRHTDLLTQMRLTFPGGDQKTVALEDLEVNVPVTDEMFRQQ